MMELDQQLQQQQPQLQSQLQPQLQSPAPPITSPVVQGDPATRKFGLFLLATLAIVTIGAAVGIGVGNISHYRYYGPTNETFFFNVSSIREVLDIRGISPKTREFWLLMNKSPDDFFER